MWTASRAINQMSSDVQTSLATGDKARSRVSGILVLYGLRAGSKMLGNAWRPEWSGWGGGGSEGGG
jgi:hypothetical protein